MDSEGNHRSDAPTRSEHAPERETSAVERRGNPVDYDAELRRHNEILRGSYDLRADDRVLDVGCGAGQTTRDAARLAVSGTVVGVDISEPMIQRARRLTEAAGLHNVTFKRADAASHRFAPEYFDVAISRFGTMFFSDPVAAFTNIGKALRPNGRLVMMVWREQHLNEWSVSIRRALANHDGAPAASGRSLDAFSLADPTVTRRVLDAAGFTDPAFTDVHEPVYYGPDVAAALEWVSGFSCVDLMMRNLDAISAAQVRERLREAFAAHARGDGVWFDSRAWLVSARRR
jgi:SAM-dependent methyltransferase